MAGMSTARNGSNLRDDWSWIQKSNTLIVRRCRRLTASIYHLSAPRDSEGKCCSNELKRFIASALVGFVSAMVVSRKEFVVR